MVKEKCPVVRHKRMESAFHSYAFTEKNFPDIWRTAGKDSGSKAFFSWKGARFTGYSKRQQVFSEETLTALLFPHLFCESGETVTIKYSVCAL